MVENNMKNIIEIFIDYTKFLSNKLVNEDEDFNNLIELKECINELGDILNKKNEKINISKYFKQKDFNSIDIFLKQIPENYITKEYRCKSININKYYQLSKGKYSEGQIKRLFSAFYDRIIH